jgi:hypothetical protein
MLVFALDFLGNQGIRFAVSGFYCEFSLRFPSGLRFLLVDSTQDLPELERILVFSSDEGLSRLQSYPHWASDGTFDSAPIGFAQLYSIHVIVSFSNFKFSRLSL